MDIVHSYRAAVRGYHNFYDSFAVKTVRKNGETVGHLPRELSRVTLFFWIEGFRFMSSYLHVITDGRHWFKERWKFHVPCS